MAITCKPRILIPPESWTAIQTDVFGDVLPYLQQKRAAQLYCLLYDRARHSPTGLVAASVAELARWTGLNVRTVSNCLKELREQKFVLRKKIGVKHSRIHKPCWRVPLAEFSTSTASWVPVPRFLIQEYCRQYPGAVILLVLLRHQHIHWLNDCWPGVPRLGKILNWSPSRVRNAIHTMGYERPWKTQGTGLPRPLEITWRTNPQGESRRHFRVLAIRYKKGTRRSGPTLSIAPDFATFFKIPAPQF
jgi:hypothetical protein